MAPRRILSGIDGAERLAGLLLPVSSWKPFPPASEREPWERLPADARDAIINGAARQADDPWPSLSASAFLDFQRNGNRSRFEQLHFGRRARLRRSVIAECMEDKGRFLDDILDGLWLICEESFWGVPAHLGMQRSGVGLPDVDEPIVDLFAAETANTLAWTKYLLGSRLEPLSPLLLPRLHREVKRRLLDPCWSRTDFWWMALGSPAERVVNNWNPWINSNWLTCALLMESDPQRRAAAVDKILDSLDRFLDYYHDDGGCEEGPRYWDRAGASLFDCLELLHSATAGKLDFYSNPLVKEIGRYIYRMHVAGDWYTNFADASAKIVPDGSLVWRYGLRIGDEKMAALGAWVAAQHGNPPVEADSLGRWLDELFHLEPLRKASTSAKPPLLRDVFLPGVGVFAARIREGSTDGFYLAAQAGHNGESHNHNDVGNFIVYFNGEPVLIDIGVETYTDKTFSDRRYEIWTMQSAWHNCPTINGTMQNDGPRFQARDVQHHADDNAAEFALDIDRAYPPEAGVERWHRIARLDRASNTVEITDRFKLAKAQSLEINLITAREPREVSPGEIALSGDVHIAYDRSLKPAFDSHSSADPLLKPVWGPVVHRIRLTATPPPFEGGFTIRISHG
ncbi:MAG: heparinase II/III family protein [Acidobacteriales bacterium]|nr:heparinase II/III family protein [Candidatus Koribacter versatilis]MBI3646781.1 heparinase II/III family protein [Terriglobales bacterium]